MWLSYVIGHVVSSCDPSGVRCVDVCECVCVCDVSGVCLCMTRVECVCVWDMSSVCLCMTRVVGVMCGLVFVVGVCD